MLPVRPTPERQRRILAAPLGLVLLGWGLGLGPLAHAVLAHGDPVVHDGGDPGWVAHSERPGRHPDGQPASPSGHRHAPGAPEHLRLAVLPSVVVLVVAVVLVAVDEAEVPGWEAPVLARWRLPEVPCGP